jgi:hypothetical protein
MPRYIITSPRVGTVGDEINLDSPRWRGVNLDALVAGGFITETDSESSTKKATKRGKNEIVPDDENPTDTINEDED